MFGVLFKQKDISKKRFSEQAEGYYRSALTQTRKPEFYTDYSVPDSFEGRFDLLLVNLFLILNRLRDNPDYTNLSQELFDVTFRNMDQTLREVGIGDMGVPKRMRRMMKAFNGRMHAYEMALAPQRLEGVKIEGLPSGTLAEALQRNVYAGQGSENAIALLETYIKKNMTDLKVFPDGQVIFAGI